MNTDFESPDPESAEGDPPPLPAADLPHAPHLFRGTALQPFSVHRQAAAQALGNRLLSGRARIETIPCHCRGEDKKCKFCRGTGEKGTAYDGMFADVLALLYLCTQPPALALRAFRQPDAIMAAALAWADTEKLTIGSPAYLEASQIYSEILRELQESHFKVTETLSGAAPKNAGGVRPTDA